MHDARIDGAFEATVLLSTCAALAMGLARARSKGDAASDAEEPPATRRFPLAALALHPLAQLVLVCALLYANQVLFGAYVLRAHGGSSEFIARYISHGWFHIGTQDPLVRLAALRVGDPAWLSPTVLRVQAFLELPFTVFAYLAVARLLGRGLYRRLCRGPSVALASLSFSVTFSLVELSLPNPFTRDDLLLRALACLTVPVYVAWIARLEGPSSRAAPRDEGPSGVLGLLAFLAGAGAIAYAVLAVYDAFLLYNLAHLPRYAAGLATALGVAALASAAAPRIDAFVARAAALRPSVAMDATTGALRAFTLLFFVPSLSLRYWGQHASAALCGVLLVVVGAVAGGALALLRASEARELGAADIARFVAAGAAALGSGAWAGQAAIADGARGGMPELDLARAALSFLVVAIVVFRAVEIALCWGPHETKAQADQA
jgi:hypothetical protein